jgi:hypothetical protein
VGNSIVLLKKEFMELSLEIDRDVQIEMSTGFGISERVTAHIGIPINLDELDSIIQTMIETRDELRKCWKCPHCGAINKEEWKECNTCCC